MVDPELERAEFVAAEAEQLLGCRPPAFASLEEAAATIPELDVVDVVAAPSAHHAITRTAVAAGMHVLCEKPMAPTVAACRAMQHAAEQAGRVLSWLYDDSMHGPGLRRFTLFGSEGQIDLPGVRSGRPLRVFRDDHDGAISDDAVLALVPDFALEERTARLFGGEPLARYENVGAGMGGGADLKLLAVELAELLDAADGGPQAEVGPEVGLSAVALVLACHESSVARRPVALSEVIDGTRDAYQCPANDELGLSGRSIPPRG